MFYAADLPFEIGGSAVVSKKGDDLYYEKSFFAIYVLDHVSSDGGNVIACLRRRAGGLR